MSAATAVKTKSKEKVESGDINSKIIRKHVLLSMGVGVIPVPLLDIAGITAINLRMISKIAKNHGDTFNKQIATNIISSLIASMGAQGAASGAFGSLVKAIPFAGSIFGAVTYPAVAGATTFALGQVFTRHYEAGGSLLTLDPDTVKDFYKEQYDKGRNRVKNIKDAAIGKSKK